MLRESLHDIAELATRGALLLGHPERLGKTKFYRSGTRAEQLGYLRDQRWRYGKWPDGEELYNLTNDPHKTATLRTPQARPSAWPSSASF